MEKRIKPNLSDRINTRDCQECGGECCKKFWIWYPHDADEIALSEMTRFKLLKGMENVVESEYVLGTGYKLTFNIPCRHLKDNGKCAIYDSPHRPLLCRMFPHPGDAEEECKYLGCKEDE